MKTVAGYEVEGLLGRGSMGRVFRARPVGGGAEVALKLLPWVGDQLPLEQLRSEVAVLSRLGHPHIVKVLELVSAGNGLVIAMQLVHGGSLADVLSRQGQLPVTAAAELLANSADALGASHAHGIVHADVKPANILLGASGGPVLTDFGLVRRIASASGPGGARLGTAEYLDPVVAEGATPSPASDVYSLGVVGYEVLAGRLPYRGVTPLDTLRAAERGRLPPLTQVAPHLDVGLAAVVEQAMSRDPAKRPSSAGELADAIRAFRRPRQERDGEGSDCLAGPRPLRRRREVACSRDEGSVSPRTIRSLGTKATVVTLVVALAMGWRLLAPSAGATSSSRTCVASSPPTPPKTYADGGVTILADVDGRGCRRPVKWYAGTITVAREPGRAPDRFTLGEVDDVLLLGRWDCASVATPALYRPSTGQIFYFDQWAKPGRDLVPSRIDPTGVIGGTARVVAGHGRGCDTVLVTRASP